MLNHGIPAGTIEYESLFLLGEELFVSKTCASESFQSAIDCKLTTSAASVSIVAYFLLSLKMFPYCQYSIQHFLNGN